MAPWLAGAHAVPNMVWRFTALWALGAGRAVCVVTARHSSQHHCTAAALIPQTFTGRTACVRFWTSFMTTGTHLGRQQMRFVGGHWEQYKAVLGCMDVAVRSWGRPWMVHGE